MSYIVEQLSLYENGQVRKTNLVMKDDLVYARDIPVNRMSFMRLNLDNHILLAAETIFGSVEQWLHGGNRYADACIRMGATTVIFAMEIDYERQFDNLLKKTRKALASFPLDYVIIAKVPMALVRPSLLRRCKQNHIPAVIVAIEAGGEIGKVAWSRMREAIFPYKMVFVPEYAVCSDKQKYDWQTCMQKDKLPHLQEPLRLNEHLPKDALKKFGIYPFKGIIRNNGEISYNVIKENDLNCLIPLKTTYHDYIQYTVFHNKVIRAGNETFIPEKPGAQMDIAVPGFFQ
ncbi:hypothetical protein [Bacillus sp. 1P06AnD]|uniref:hypothetical protein n=1 Tax=Bacillus sp. 1P06AnD TaxID=3132208 RepID=UPI0039A0CFF8